MSVTLDAYLRTRFVANTGAKWPLRRVNGPRARHDCCLRGEASTSTETARRERPVRVQVRASIRVSPAGPAK